VETDRDILLVPLKPAGAPTPWAAGPRIQAEPALSPDGRWLAYSSEESGNFEVLVRAFPGPGPRYQISNGGGQSPRWNPQGGELFFLARDSLMAVPLIPKGPALEQGRTRALFPFHYRLGNFHAAYDVSPDGTWFVAAGSTGLPSANLRVVLNWFDQPWKD
jgi:serine/threonine-protein kinase